MALEFSCPHCNSKLRTPEEARGRKAKCPKCGSIVTIPGSGSGQAGPQGDGGQASGQAAGGGAPGSGDAGGPQSPSSQQGESWPFGDQGASAPPPPPGGGGSSQMPPGSGQTPPGYGAANPYQAPATSQPFAQEATGGELGHGQLSFSGLIHESIEVFKRAWGPLLLAGVAVFAISVGLSLISALFQVAAAASGGEEAAALAQILLTPVTQLIMMVVTLVVLRFTIGVVRGDPNPSGRLFPPVIVFLVFIGLNLVYAVLILVGLALFIVPGIIISLTFLLAPALVADREMGFVEAFAKSAECMRGNRLTVLGTGLVVYLVCMLLTLVTCGLGLIVVAPFLYAFFAVIYLRATGQATLLDR